MAPNPRFVEGGTVVGYMSVRTRPSRDQVSAAEQLYRLAIGVNPNRITDTPSRG